MASPTRVSVVPVANAEHTNNSGNGISRNDDMSDDDDGESKSRPIRQQSLDGTVLRGLGHDIWDNFDAKIDGVGWTTMSMEID